MAHEGYDFEFSLGSASENGHNAPKARYDWSRTTGNARFRSHMGLKPWKIVSEDLTRLPKSRLLLLGNWARVLDGDKGSRTTSAAFILRQGSWTETKLPESRCTRSEPPCTQQIKRFFAPKRSLSLKHQTSNLKTQHRKFSSPAHSKLLFLARNPTKNGAFRV